MQKYHYEYISKYNYILRGVSKIYLTGHVTAYISDYKVYDNHTLPASENPTPWPKHKKFNSISLDNDFKDFLKLNLFLFWFFDCHFFAQQPIGKVHTLLIIVG